MLELLQTFRRERFFLGSFGDLRLLALRFDVPLSLNDIVLQLLQFLPQFFLRLRHFIEARRRSFRADAEDSDIGPDLVRLRIGTFVGRANLVGQPLTLFDLERTEIERETVLDLFLTLHLFGDELLRLSFVDLEVQFQLSDADVVRRGDVDRDRVVRTDLGALISLHDQMRRLVGDDDQFTRHGVVVRQLVDVSDRERIRADHFRISEHFDGGGLLVGGELERQRLAPLSPNQRRSLDRLVEFQFELQSAPLERADRTDRTVERLRRPTGIRGRLDIDANLRDHGRLNHLHLIVPRLLPFDRHMKLQIAHDMRHDGRERLTRGVIGHRAAVGRPDGITPFQ